MPSRPRQPTILQTPVSPAPATIFCRLPQSHHVPLAHLVADLIRRRRAAAQDKEDTRER
jgi:hypothetical protein